MLWEELHLTPVTISLLRHPQLKSDEASHSEQVSDISRAASRRPLACSCAAIDAPGRRPSADATTSIL